MMTCLSFRAVLVSFLLVGVLGVGFIPSPVEASQHDGTLRQDLQNVVDDLARAVNDGSVSGVLGFLTDDARVAFPGGDVAQGTAQLQALFSAIFPLPTVESKSIIHIQPLQLGDSGAPMSVFVVSDLTLHNRSTGVPVENGSDAMVWTRASNSAPWLMSVEMPAFNGPPPCQAEPSFPKPAESDLVKLLQSYRDRFAGYYAARNVSALVSGWDPVHFVIKHASGAPPVTSYAGLPGHYTYLLDNFPIMKWETTDAKYSLADGSVWEWMVWSFRGPHASISGRGLINWLKQPDGSWLQISEQDNCGPASGAGSEAHE